MAPGKAESDFRQQGWIDTLGLKQIFSIVSVELPSVVRIWCLSSYRPTTILFTTFSKSVLEINIFLSQWFLFTFHFELQRSND